MTITERNTLVLDYLPLAEKLAYKKSRTTPLSIQVDELKSAAYMGLVDAACKYNPDKSAFGTYAYLRIVGEMKDYLRQISWGPRGAYVKPFSLDRPIGDDNCTFASLLEERKSSFAKMDAKEFFEYVTSDLNDIEKHVIILYYVESKTLREIGNTINLGKSRISQILKKCIASLRNKFIGD